MDGQIPKDTQNAGPKEDNQLKKIHVFQVISKQMHAVMHCGAVLCCDIYGGGVGFHCFCTGCLF